MCILNCMLSTVLSEIYSVQLTSNQLYDGGYSVRRKNTMVKSFLAPNHSTRHLHGHVHPLHMEHTRTTIVSAVLQFYLLWRRKNPILLTMILLIWSRKIIRKCKLTRYPAS